MQQGIKFTKVWCILWFFTSRPWLDITHTYKDTAHTQGLIDWLPYKFILTPPVIAFQKLLTCRSHIYLLIRFNKTKFFPWNAKYTNRNGLSKKTCISLSLKIDCGTTYFGKNHSAMNYLVQGNLLTEWQTHWLFSLWVQCHFELVWI